MAVGIRPNTELAEKMQLHVNRGIVVSDTLQTVTDARIYAVGECANHRGIAYGLVAPLYEQARVVANHLAGFGIAWRSTWEVEREIGEGNIPVRGGSGWGAQHAAGVGRVACGSGSRTCTGTSTLR